MPPWFATLDGYAILASANFGFAQDDTLSYRFVATLTLASPVQGEVAFSQENDGRVVYKRFCFGQPFSHGEP